MRLVKFNDETYGVALSKKWIFFGKCKFADFRFSDSGWLEDSVHINHCKTTEEKARDYIEARKYNYIR